MVNEVFIKQLQNILRVDDGIDGDAQRIRQLTWLLFLKIIDDKEMELELFNNRTAIIPEGFRWRDWAANDEGITGDELINFVNNKLFPALRGLSTSDDEFTNFVGSVFQDNYNFAQKGTVLKRVINKINEINFNNQLDRHVIGDIYEKLLNDLQYAGNDGEVYTPRPVTRFIVDMIKPKLGDKILDPACGTGGFLVDSIEYVRRNQVKTAEDESVLKSSIYGIEKKPLPYLLCVTNFLLHDVEAPTTIRRGNILARPMRDIGPSDRVDVIVANPPFSGSEDVGIEQNFPSGFKTKTTGDLFMYAFMRLLKKEGKAGVVMPSSFLSGAGAERNLKEKLIKEFNLHTIVLLKRGVFYKPVTTVILFFNNEGTTKDIWFYDMPLPNGIKQYTKGNPLTHAEFEPIKEWWDNRTENDNAWKVDAKKFEETDYDMHMPNPSKVVVKEFIGKDQLLTEAKTLSNDISKIIDEIQKAFN
jgi:type I restriction enzyme M protein